MIASRNDIADARTTSPNYGAIDGFPITISINGNYSGMYTFNIPKDAWTFDMGNANTEYVICGEEYASPACSWNALATIDGHDFSVEYAADGVEASTIASSLNNAISVALSSTTTWETDIAPYLDVQSVFDYFIFMCCINGHDNLSRNAIYGTYDGVKWFMSAYDMDTTYGVNTYGSQWYEVVNDRNQFAQAATRHKLMYLIYNYSKARLVARYKELRATVLSDANVFHVFADFITYIPEREYGIGFRSRKNKALK